MKIKILIVDDHALMRLTIKNYLEEFNTFEVIGESENGFQGVEKAKELKPDLVIMDIAMPDMNGIEATRRIVKNDPHVKVIGVSMHCTRYFMAELLEAGASIVISKDSILDELINVITTVMNVNIYT